METEPEVNEKRLKVKNEITEGIKHTPMARLFNVTSYVVQKITGYPKQLPLAYCIAVLSLVFLLITLLFFKTQIMIRPGLLSIIFLGESGLLSIVFTYFNINRVLRGIRDTVVDSITSSQNLSDLQQWLSFGWSSKIIKRFQWIYAVFFAAISLFLFPAIGFSGFGILSLSILYGFVGSIAWYYVPLMLLLPIRLSAYQFRLYESDPARSEIIEDMSAILSRFTFGYVSISALVQLSLASINLPIFEAIVFMVVIGWMPVTIQYFVNQFSIRNIISSSKRKTLNRVQAQIKVLHDGDITNKDNMEMINGLMDYHERIRATPNSTLNIGGFLNFLNQLALSLLGFLLGNTEKIIDFFR